MDYAKKGRRNIIGQLIKYSVIIIASLIVCIIASAYVWYFIGMTFSLAFGLFVGLTGAEIATIFAWIGVGVTVYIFVKLFVKALGKLFDGTINVHHVDASELSDEEFKKLFEDIKEKE